MTRPSTGADRKIGRVKNVVPERGFGFIKTEQGPEEYFFHSTACTGVPFYQLEAGTRVSFSIGTNSKGPRAEDIALAE